MAALTVWTKWDLILSMIAPIGLAAAVPTGLIIDLDPRGPVLPGVATLADLVGAGPRRVDLQPASQGTAMLSNGGIEPSDADDVIMHLLAGWPNVVLRSEVDRDLYAPVVPVHPLLPGLRFGEPERFCVFQRAGFAVEHRQEGLVIPRPPGGTVKSLLKGVLPAGNRWIRAWRQVWEYPWR